MALRWFESHQPDEIDTLLSKADRTDLALVWHFLVICGTWGAFSWFSGGGFGTGFEKGIPLAACLFIYETSIRHNLQSAELRARLIEIDGKVTALETEYALERNSKKLQDIHKMLSYLHRRLREDGDLGIKLGVIDTNIKELRWGREEEIDSLCEDLKIPMP